MYWKRVGIPLGAAVLIVVGVLVLDWANVATPMGASVRLSPLGEEVCLGDVCAQATRGFGTWKACARPLVLLGGVTALAMIGVVLVRLLGIGLGPLERAVTWLAVTLIASAGAAMVASGASLGELGGGGFVTVIGGVLALVSKVSLGASFGTGRSAFLIEGVPLVRCPNCGESYFTADTLHELERIQLHRKTFAPRRPVAVAAFL